MASNNQQDSVWNVAAAVDRGRSQGLAIGALALSIVSYLNLLGAEKSGLAIILGVMAYSGSTEPATRRRSRIAIGLALLQMVTIAVVLIVFRDRIGPLVHALHALG